MMEKLCLFYLLSNIISVSTNPLGQLLHSCNVCQPSSYSNPASIPVVIQQPSNTNSYSQANTALNPTAFAGPLGDNLNQVLLNKILGNPSLQKIIDPNTKLVNQNGEPVKRQVSNTGVPNVINNYFIVPPEFFNLNETVSKNDEVLVEKVKRPRRRKVKKKLKKVQQSPEDDANTRKNTSKRRNQKELETVKSKRTRIDENDSVEISEVNDSQEKSRKVEENKQKHRQKKKKIAPPPIEESDDDEYLEWEDPVVDRGDEIKKSRKSKPKPIIVDNESNEIENEAPKSKINKSKSSSHVTEEDIDNEIEISQSISSKKSQRKEVSDNKLEDKILKNIEIPTDVSNRVSSENRKTRDSKRNGSKRDPAQRQMSRKEQSNITPFPDEVLKSFFPHMPMGNPYNSNTNYPYNFNQYYQYLDPARNNEANRNKRRRKNQNRKNNQPTSKTHTIEIKLKPKKKDNSTEDAVTTEKPKDVEDITVSIEVDQSTESIEEIRAIPMEVPQKVSPVNTDDEDSTESYETFSKLEDLHEFITPELGNEDEVHPMDNNGIINDYYPVFDDDVYYNPYVEKVKNLDDDRYYYETGSDDKINKERRKFDRYEEPKSSKRDTKIRESEIIDTKTNKVSKSDPEINKYDHNEYLDHITTFSDSSEHETVKLNDEIRRVKVPPKNTRVQSEKVETVSAGSKVVKYGIPSDESVEDTSSSNNDDKTFVGTTYVVAKSLGKPEDYY